MDFLDSGIDEFYTQDNEEYENEEEKSSNENNEDSKNNQGELESREKSENRKSRPKKYNRNDSQILKGTCEKSADDSSGDKTDDDIYSKDKVSKLR